MAFMSQSGALGTAVLDIALAGRLGLSRFVSLGNKADVSEIDLLQAWVDDPHTNVIMIYSEGLPNGQEFIRVAEQVTRRMPVIAIKSGVTQSGSRAVSSHTGSLAGSEQAYQAAFSQAGILRAEVDGSPVRYGAGNRLPAALAGRPHRYRNQRWRTGHPGNRRAGTSRDEHGALQG